MAEKTAKKTAKVPTQRARTTAKKTTKAAEPKTAVERTTEVSEDVLKSVENGQRAAIDAVRKFMERIDDVLPDIAGSAKRRETVIDAALEMADRLVTTQYDFLRSVVHDASRRLAGTTKK
jgi:archaellum component FlaC